MLSGVSFLSGSFLSGITVSGCRSGVLYCLELGLAAENGEICPGRAVDRRAGGDCLVALVQHAGTQRITGDRVKLRCPFCAVWTDLSDGADSWELFRAWLYVLLPLALIARQNSLWFCSWLVANLAFQLYYNTLPSSLLDLAASDSLTRLPTAVLYGYLALLAACLIVREALAWRAITHQPESWLASRWFSRVMAGFLLLQLTAIVAGNLSDWGGGDHLPNITGGWVITLLAGYYLYRYRYPDLCMLTLGIASLTVVGCALIMQLFLLAYDTGDLFLTAS